MPETELRKSELEASSLPAAINHPALRLKKIVEPKCGTTKGRYTKVLGSGLYSLECSPPESVLRFDILNIKDQKVNNFFHSKYS